MTQALVSALRSVELGVPDPAVHEHFYTAIWGLEVGERVDDALFLRATGADHHVLALHRRDAAALLSITLRASSRQAVDALARQATSAGGTIIDPPAAIREPGAGYGFRLCDPEGRVFRIVADDARVEPLAARTDRPDRLAHVVLNSANRTAASRFCCEALGFRLSDRTRIMDFVRCNRDHHSIAFADGKAPTLNHVAFNMPDIDSMMRGAGRLRDAGYRIEWGVGRHGPGNNVFAYFVAPDDVAVEYTAEVEQVDETYRTGGPEDWTWPPGRVDHWGVSDPPSARLKEAQERIRFAPPPASR